MGIYFCQKERAQDQETNNDCYLTSSIVCKLPLPCEALEIAIKRQDAFHELMNVR